MPNTRIAKSARQAHKDFEDAARSADKCGEDLAGQLLRIFAAVCKVESICAEYDDMHSGDADHA